MELAGRVALVTGGAHRVGGAIAWVLAEAGCRLLIHHRDSRAEGEELAGRIRDAGGESRLLQADLSDLAELRRLADEALAAHGGLDILVNSAASFKKQPLAKVTPESWDASQAVNVRAPFFLTQALAPAIAATSRPGDVPGLVINIADLSGVNAWKGYVQHGVSKAALLHLTAILARELAPGVRVNAIVPGAILPPPKQDPEGELWLKMSSANPLGHPGEPADIGRAVRFLAESDFMTGAVLRVDGGEGLLGPVNH